MKKKKATVKKAVTKPVAKKAAPKKVTPKKAAKLVQKKAVPKTAAKKKVVYRKSTDKVGDVLVNQAGVKYKITGERYATPAGHDDGKLKVRILEITPEKKTGIKPFETNDTMLKHYRDKKVWTRVKKKAGKTK